MLHLQFLVGKQSHETRTTLFTKCVSFFLISKISLPMVQFECPRHWNFWVTSILGDSLFLMFSLWANKELALLSIKVKSWKNFRTKSAQEAANGPVWMPQALKPLGHIHFLGESLFLMFSLWANKELALPSIKVQSWKNFRTKSAQQAANGPVWMPQALKLLCHIHFGWIPFSHVQPLG